MSSSVENDLQARIKATLTQPAVGESSQAKLEYYPARDGTPIPMWVRSPKNCEQPCPIIVFFHGGPHNQALPGYEARAEVFLQEGFIYVAPNIRGSSGFGPAWRNADKKEKRLQVISDIDDCGKYLKTRYSANGRAPKVGILGWSYGGYIALMGMTMFAGTYDAGYAIAAKTDLYSFFRNAPAELRKERREEYGDPDESPELFRQLSPITYVDRVTSPITLVLGEKDPKISMPDGLKFIESLKRRGVPAELRITKESHYTTALSSQISEYAGIAEFFHRYLR